MSLRDKLKAMAAPRDATNLKRSAPPKPTPVDEFSLKYEGNRENKSKPGLFDQGDIDTANRKVTGTVGRKGK